MGARRGTQFSGPDKWKHLFHLVEHRFNLGGKKNVFFWPMQLVSFSLCACECVFVGSSVSLFTIAPIILHRLIWLARDCAEHIHYSRRRRRRRGRHRNIVIVFHKFNGST